MRKDIRYKTEVGSVVGGIIIISCAPSIGIKPSTTHKRKLRMENMKDNRENKTEKKSDKIYER